jgi:hypothetical protein
MADGTWHCAVSQGGVGRYFRPASCCVHPNWQCGRTAGSGTDRRLHRTNVAWHAGGPLASPPRFQAELARLVFKVSARTVAKYMQRTDHRGPSPQWRSFLRQHASTVWACDFFCVQAVMFRTLRVFFVIHRSSWQVLHVHVTGHPTASRAAQQIAECCGWDCQPARFLVHDGDSCFGASFDRRVRNLGTIQARTPFRSPRANAIAER